MITDCRTHINAHPGIDPAIVAYLTLHTNAIMCAEIESVVTRLIRERIERGSDEASGNFLKSWRRGILRNARYSEIRDTIGLFGDEYKSRFIELINNSVGEIGIEALGIAVGGRDETAHGTPPNITFQELEIAYTVASTVVDMVNQVLQ